MPRKNLTVAEIVAQRKARTYTHRLYLDPDLALAYEDLVESLDDLRTKLESARFNAKYDADLLPESAAAHAAVIKREEEIAEAKAALEETVVELRFAQISRKQFEDLLEAHPTSEEQKARYGDKAAALDAEALAPALMASSAVAPKMSLEEATELWTTQMTVQDAGVLYNRLLDLNSRQVDSLGKG